jgi:ArsR family transcriptional regulator
MEDAQFHRISKALADPTRFEILQMLAESDELYCREIKERLTVAQPTISHHLKELTYADLVIDRRDGQFIYYRLRREVLAEYSALLGQRLAIPLLDR